MCPKVGMSRINALRDFNLNPIQLQFYCESAMRALSCGEEHRLFLSHIFAHCVLTYMRRVHSQTSDGPGGLATPRFLARALLLRGISHLAALAFPPTPHMNGKATAKCPVAAPLGYIRPRSWWGCRRVMTRPCGCRRPWCRFGVYR